MCIAVQLTPQFLQQNVNTSFAVMTTQRSSLEIAKYVKIFAISDAWQWDICCCFVTARWYIKFNQHRLQSLSLSQMCGPSKIWHYSSAHIYLFSVFASDEIWFGIWFWKKGKDSTNSHWFCFAPRQIRLLLQKNPRGILDSWFEILFLQFPSVFLTESKIFYGFDCFLKKGLPFEWNLFYCKYFFLLPGRFDWLTEKKDIAYNYFLHFCDISRVIWLIDFGGKR